MSRLFCLNQPLRMSKMFIFHMDSSSIGNSGISTAKLKSRNVLKELIDAPTKERCFASGGGLDDEGFATTE